MAVGRIVGAWALIAAAVGRIVGGGSACALIAATVESAGVEPRQNRALVLWTPTVDT